MRKKLWLIIYDYGISDIFFLIQKRPMNHLVITCSTSLSVVNMLALKLLEVVFNQVERNTFLWSCVLYDYLALSSFLCLLKNLV